MSIDSINDFSQTPNDNTDIAGTNIAVNCPPQDVGVYMRTMMAMLAYIRDGVSGKFPATWFVGKLNATMGGKYVGEIFAWPEVSPPSGSILAFGQAISRTTYADLFAVLGTGYGSGDGSTTFNVPDYRGCTLVGADNMGGTPANRVTAAGSGVDGSTVGASGGNQLTQTHNHGVADPGHTHGVADPGHAHGVSDPGHTHLVLQNVSNRFSPGSVITGTGNVGIDDEATTASTTGISIAGAFTGIGIYGATTGVTTNGYGAGGSQNMQPSRIVSICIYAGV